MTHLSLPQMIRYRDGQLSAEEAAEVEAHLEHCLLCRQALKGFTRRPIGEKAALQAQERMHQKLQSRLGRSASPFSKWWYPGLVALVLLLAGTGWWFYRDAEPQNTYERYYASFGSGTYGQLRGDHSSVQSNHWEQGLYAYDQGRYEAAIAAWEKDLPEAKAPGKVAFFLGLSLMEIQRIPEAIPYLEQARFNQIDLYEAATWYLALAYLHEDQKMKSQKLLEELIRGKAHAFTESAKSLYRELEKEEQH